MTQLAWDADGERVYEAGCDRGVLYLTDQPGVVWNGLISVSETTDGGEVSSHYQDGMKFALLIGVEEFTAQIEAYTYPDQFALCDGTEEIENGLFVTQQTRQSFGLSYRTKVGNDVDGVDHGYKIHLVYNAYASPSDRDYTSFSESIEPTTFRWDITTIPLVVPEKRPSAHFEIDSRETSPFLLSYIESVLYGSGINEPRLPTLTELVAIFRQYTNDENIDGGFSDSFQDYQLDGGFSDAAPTTTLDAGSAA